MENIKLYAYFNIENPMVAWEVAIGRVRSVCDRNPNNLGISLWQYSMLRDAVSNGVGNRARHELGLEICRQQRFPEKVSRLKGVYFFKTMDMALAALDRWKLNRHKKNLSQVNFSAENFSEYDSEWITSYFSGSECDWYSEYLSGSTLGAAPLTEVVASGIGYICSEDLRRRAYAQIFKKYPTSTPLLATAMTAFCDLKIEDAASIRPFLISDEDRMKCEFYINTESIRVNQMKIYNSMLNLKRKNLLPSMAFAPLAKGLVNEPDFSSLAFEFSFVGAGAAYRSVHAAE